MRKICLVTSTRADYGIMSDLIDLLSKDDGVDFSLIVTGTHLSKKYGLTKKEIYQKIYSEIDIKIESEPANVLAVTIKKFDKLIKKLQPDLMILLGDRYEIFGVAQSCMLNNIPIAHLYGGDTTEGAIDEAIRHSITKMSHLHFPSCEEYGKRIIQMGENPERVFNFGALGVEHIKKIKLLTKEELETSLNFKFAEKNLLVTFHPVTLENNSAEQFSELLLALEKFKDTNIIITYPNSDKGSEKIFELIENFEKKSKNVFAFKSLGGQKYLSCMQFVNAVIGNSSSGIYEAPSFKIPTVNIGNRQKGRVQAKSVINCEPNKYEISNAIKAAFSMDCSSVKNPYEGENTAECLIEIIKTFNLNDVIKKEFYDISKRTAES